MSKFEAAKAAINALFSDDTVTKEQTKEWLEEILDEIEVMVDSLDLDDDWDPADQEDDE
jgi:ribosome assembly protein YihI (activator of Der GTPase)